MPQNHDMTFGEVKRRLEDFFVSMSDTTIVKEFTFNVDYDWRDKQWIKKGSYKLHDDMELYGTWFTMKAYIPNPYHEEPPMDHAGIKALEKELKTVDARIEELKQAHNTRLANVDAGRKRMDEKVLERQQIIEALEYLKKNHNARLA